MADSTRRYYWLKLKEDFFDDDTIAWIEEQENGKEYCLFYLKLCLKALKTNGVLIRCVGDVIIPYDIKKLADITNTDFDTAMVAVKLFEKIGLVQTLENGELFLSKLNELVGSETNKAALMRRKRAQIGSGNNVTAELPQSYQNVTERIEIRDKSLDTRDKRLESNREAAASLSPAPVPYSKIKELYNSICTAYPKCTAMSEARKKAIAARIHSGYTVDDFQLVFEKAQASSFLKGSNNRNWRASFDWLIKDSNMAKVLDGNYDNKGQTAQYSPAADDLDFIPN